MVLSYDNAECREVAAELLRRHGELQAEANITSQIREFLVRTGLVDSSDIREEISPAEGSGNSVDLAALDTLIEVKRRIGNCVCQTTEGCERSDGRLEETRRDAVESQPWLVCSHIRAYDSRGARVRMITSRFHSKSSMNE